MCQIGMNFHLRTLLPITDVIKDFAGSSHVILFEFMRY